ncbi:MAG: LCP family protein [Oscillospiraceae bacterium]|nr:LCP family protein [Oscillospiraceae bacterium]
MRIRKKNLKGILLAIAVAALLIAVYILAGRFEASQEVAPEGADTAASRTTVKEEDDDTDAVSPLDDDGEATSTIYYNGAQYATNENLTTLLILGIDDYELTESDSYRNSGQADLILLAIFDNDAKTCTLLHINRDTMTDVSVLGALGDYIGVTNEQIALAHTYGSGLEDSCENTVTTVSSFLYGVTIDNYLSLTMDAVAVLNDLVGGVTVTIEDDFTGVDDTLVQGETVTLMGEHALYYVRARSSMTDDSTNLARMERQKTYMTALSAALKEAVAEDSAFLLEAYTAVADYLVTDCDINALSDYGSQLTEYTLSEIISPEGEAVLGDVYMEYYVDEAALQQLVIDLFYIPVDEE